MMRGFQTPLPRSVRRLEGEQGGGGPPRVESIGVARVTISVVGMLINRARVARRHTKGYNTLTNMRSSTGVSPTPDRIAPNGNDLAVQIRREWASAAQYVLALTGTNAIVDALHHLHSSIFVRARISNLDVVYSPGFRRRPKVALRDEAASRRRPDTSNKVVRPVASRHSSRKI